LHTHFAYISFSLVVNHDLPQQLSLHSSTSSKQPTLNVQIQIWVFIGMTILALYLMRPPLK